MIEQNLGSSLRGLREQQGMSLRALAERVDFSASFLSQIENGQCSPSISSMEKIANALGVTLGQFFLSANQHVVNIVRASERCGNPGLATPIEPGTPEGQRERRPVSL